MATVIATTRSIKLQQSGVTTYTITLSQPATAGSKLVMVGGGGATVTARINNSSGTLFQKRTEALGDQSLSIQDYTAVGGETQVHVTLNGPENTDAVIYEVSGLGNFIAASNGASGSVTAANNYQLSPPSSVAIPSGKAVLFAGWSAKTTTAFSETIKWRQMGPIGKIWDTYAVQPGSASQYIAGTGLADVTATGRYPENLAVGSYQATSMFIQPTSFAYTAQAAYEDLSNVPTNPPLNPIAAENSLPGLHTNNWFLGANATNPTIAGYTDKCSYLPGETVNFMVDSTGNPFRVEVYRLGHYGWESFGARSMTGKTFITGTVTAQPAPVVDYALGSSSCSWTANASWSIPASAPPGIYYVAFRRTDDTSKVAGTHFVVRSASVTGKVAFCIPDMTYQAYNLWGATTDFGSRSTGTWTGRNLYGVGTDPTNAAQRAYAVSFNRPYGTASAQPNTYLFDDEYSLLHFMEAQGYDMTYLSNLDLDADPQLLTTAKLVVMSGHQEYWTSGVYDCYTNAVDAGVNMLICSSNTALWRTRFDSSDSARRTMICYKDSLTADATPGFTGTGYDPVFHTGTWRDTRKNFGSVYNNDVRRENALTGQMFSINAPINIPVIVPESFKSRPLWRNSASIQALSSGQQYAAQFGLFGDEADMPDGSASQPSSLAMLSPTPVSLSGQGVNAAGTIYTLPVSGTASFTIYRRASGALVFNTGSWRGWRGITRWAGNFNGIASTDLNWQNALLAVLYDLGAAPTTLKSLQPGIDPAPTDPSVNAPTGTRDDIATAYGISFSTTPVGTVRRGDFFVFYA